MKKVQMNECVNPFINQLLSITNKGFTSVDNRLKIRSALLDLFKAFDKIWHHELIFKLKYF